MRFTYLYLENYIGIYNGMGLHKIEINLALCRHKMLIIRGENGSGKSTIFNALNVMPDSNDVFIPGMSATKIIRLQDGHTSYEMRFIHPVKSDGSRDTTKAYISRSMNNQMVELNPNGNVTSFKDILYDELGLDPNFIALSQLSLDDKGLAGKKPAERKRFVNAIMSSLEVYNNIYKALTKRSNSLKAVMNTVTTKLGALGDLTVLQANLDNLESQINIYYAEKDKAANELMKYRAQIELIDPDGSIQSKHTTLATKTAYDDKELRKLLSRFPFNIFDIDYSLEQFIVQSNNMKSEIDKKVKELDSLTIEIRSIQSIIQDYKTQESQKMDTINSLLDEDSFETICDKMVDLEEDMNDLIKKISITGIKPGLINKDEYLLALQTLKDIKAFVTQIKDRNDYQMVEEIMRRYRDGDNPSIYQVDKYQKYIDAYLEKAPILNENIRRYDEELEKLKLLDIRPSECSDDTCPFIADLVQIKERNPAQLKYQDAQILSELEICYQNAKEQIERFTEWNKCINDFRNLLRLVSLNGSILTKLPHGSIYTNIITFIDALYANEDFTYIDQLYEYIDLANCFDEYNAIKKAYDELAKKHDLYLSKYDIIDQLNSELANITTTLSEYTAKHEELTQKAKLLEENVKLLNIDYEKLLKHIDSLKSMKEIKDRIIVNRNAMNELVGNMAKINHCNEMINQASARVINATRQLEPLIKDRDKVNHSIQMVYDYQNELATIKQQYDLIESIKYYSSPTTGIQLVFMELYLGKIISLANELLSNLFNGEYIIQPFIINESEFRIPCLGNGYLNDDISSMSSAQIAMISMILSFALLYNSSTKYNIIKLDEIDGPLDENNRILFTEVLNRIMNIMNTEQCVLISHNSELNVDDSDVIVLKSDHLSREYTRGNVIWKY